VKRQPTHAEAHYYLGMLYVNRKEYAAAITHFEAAIAAKPDFREAHYSIGVCYEFYVPELTKALEHYRLFLELGGTDTRIQQLVKHSAGR
jgi:uncharacterized protein HemY